MSDLNEAEVTELELLKEKADIMGVSYHPNIGLEKLKEKLSTSAKELSTTVETKAQKNARLRREANKRIRINLVCMNPNKASWPGEIISVSNKYIGCIKEMVPFNATDGWHLPTVIVDILKDKKFQSFYTVKVDGRKVKKSRMVKEFSIEVLPELTIDELKELAAKQALDNQGE